MRNQPLLNRCVHKRRKIKDTFLCSVTQQCWPCITPGSSRPASWTPPRSKFAARSPASISRPPADSSRRGVLRGDPFSPGRILLAVVRLRSARRVDIVETRRRGFQPRLRGPPRTALGRLFRRRFTDDVAILLGRRGRRGLLGVALSYEPLALRSLAEPPDRRRGDLRGWIRHGYASSPLN